MIAQDWLEILHGFALKRAKRFRTPPPNVALPTALGFSCVFARISYIISLAGDLLVAQISAGEGGGGGSVGPTDLDFSARLQIASNLARRSMLTLGTVLGDL